MRTVSKRPSFCHVSLFFPLTQTLNQSSEDKRNITSLSQSLSNVLPAYIDAIGASQLDVEIVDLKLLRDVFYTQIAADSATVLPRKLGRDEYFVLGDNSPVSRDSRHGDLQILNAKYLLGKPLATRR